MPEILNSFRSNFHENFPAMFNNFRFFVCFLGKPPKILKEVREEKFKQEIGRIIKDNKLVPSTSEVYYDIAKDFQVEKQVVYLAVKRFVAKENMLPDTSDAEEKMESDDEEYIPPEYFGSSFKKISSDICWQLNIGHLNLFWETSDKLKESPEWSDTISSMLWEFSRLPCAWSFDRLLQICNEHVVPGRCLSNECSKLFVYSQGDQKKLFTCVKDVRSTHVRK